MTASPLNYFLHSSGPATRPTLMLEWVFTAIVVLVCLLVAILLLAAILRRRPSEGGIGEIARTGDGLGWAFTGTAISIVVLFGMSIYALVALVAVAHPPSQPALAIHVTGRDWWWQVDYPAQGDAAGDAAGFTTANELHIPTGVPVRVDLDSADVIHAFWVPQLSGKTEMIPGVTNHQWLEADKPGLYRGQCTQFCGLQHAHMAFEVVAQSPQAFAHWRQAQAQAARPPADAATTAGEQVFMEHCAACHTVRGTAAAGRYGPDLTHLASRRQIAAGTLDNTPHNLSLWVAHAQAIKPGVQMPDTALSPADASHLNRFLTELN